MAILRDAPEQCEVDDVVLCSLLNGYPAFSGKLETVQFAIPITEAERAEHRTESFAPVLGPSKIWTFELVDVILPGVTDSAYRRTK